VGGGLPASQLEARCVRWDISLTFTPEAKQPSWQVDHDEQRTAEDDKYNAAKRRPPQTRTDAGVG
jgi:hypothetical protein